MVPFNALRVVDTGMRVYDALVYGGIEVAFSGPSGPVQEFLDEIALAGVDPDATGRTPFGELVVAAFEGDRDRLRRAIGLR